MATFGQTVRARAAAATRRRAVARRQWQRARRRARGRRARADPRSPRLPCSTPRSPRLPQLRLLPHPRSRSPRARSETTHPSPCSLARPRSLSLSKRLRSLRQTQGPWLAERRCAGGFPVRPAASPGPPPESSPHRPLPLRRSPRPSTLEPRFSETKRPSLRSPQLLPSRRPLRSLRQAQGRRSAPRPLPVARRSAAACRAARAASPGPPRDSPLPRSVVLPPRSRRRRRRRPLSLPHRPRSLRRRSEAKRPSPRFRPLPPRQWSPRLSPVWDCPERRPRPKPSPRQRPHPQSPRHPHPHRSPAPPPVPRHPWLSRIVPRCRSPGRCGRGPRHGTGRRRGRSRSGTGRSPGSSGRVRC